MALAIADPAPQSFFRKIALTDADVARLVSPWPELARVGADAHLFDPRDGSYLVHATAEHEGVTFSSQPVLWSPAPRVDVLVVAGRGKTVSFVAAFRPDSGGAWMLASSFVILGEVAPVALAYRSAEKRTLWWTSCWQCRGETGHVSLRDDGRVVIVQE